MVKDKLVGVKMSNKMYDFLDGFSQEDEITIPELVRKLIKKVMEVYE